jgi:hypothetical protein
LLLGFALPIYADSAATEAAAQLAERVAAQLNSQVEYRVEFRDLTGQMPAEEISAARSAFLAALTKRGARVGASDGDALIRISLSSDTRSRLWVAEFTVQTHIEPIFVEFSAASPAPKTPPDLTSQLIYAQSLPILDFAVVKRDRGLPSELLILGTDRVSLVVKRNGTWSPASEYLFPASIRMARDPRGLIFEDSGYYWLGVSGAFCSVALQSNLQVKCDTSSKRWRVVLGDVVSFDQELVPGRNYFREPIRDDGFPFYFSRANTLTAVVIVTNENLAWILRDKLPPASVSERWGSDVAAVRSCGGSVVLTTGADDYRSLDHIRATQIQENRVSAASKNLEYDGPITALWSAFLSPTARAVVRNLRTRTYEAYEISLPCNN